MYLANILLENWIPIPDYNLDCPTTFNEQRTIRSRFEEKVNVIMSNNKKYIYKFCGKQNVPLSYKHNFIFLEI